MFFHTPLAHGEELEGRLVHLGAAARLTSPPPPYQCSGRPCAAEDVVAACARRRLVSAASSFGVFGSSFSESLCT
jgi:hypothetical protein